MKTIRTLLILAGVSLALFALGATGAKAQWLYPIQFAGTFTLPLKAQWGPMTLPAGDYTLYYGRQSPGGAYFVEVVDKEKGNSHGWVLVKTRDGASTTNNSLVCIREGDRLVVRTLEMPLIGESISFALPRGVQLLARQRNHNGSTQLAEVRMLIQVVPIELNEK